MLSQEAADPSRGQLPACGRAAAACARNSGGFCGGCAGHAWAAPGGREKAGDERHHDRAHRTGWHPHRGQQQGRRGLRGAPGPEASRAGQLAVLPQPGTVGLGQSRDKPAQRWTIDTAAEALRAAGHQVEVSIDNDTRRTFAEAEADRYQRAEDRTLYHDEVAGRAAGRSEAAYRAEHRIIEGYPAGQPILVGHHSERRHRRDLERADAYRRRAWDEQDKAGYHADRAEAAERYQAGAGVRARHPAAHRQAGSRGPAGSAAARRHRQVHELRPPRDRKWREQLLARARDIDEELDYWRKHIAARQGDGAKVWEPADFAKGDFVDTGLGAWYEVIRVNKKTLTLPAIIAGPGRTVLRADESGYPGPTPSPTTR